MRDQILLPETGLYKANLHCHTTVSDGRLTPEEIKELYMSEGYSIVAYTDHREYVWHKELDDENFLALPSMAPGPLRTGRAVTICPTATITTRPV